MISLQNPPHVTDLIPAYALGALEPDEVDVVERHIEVCPSCDEEATRAGQVADMLLAAPLIDPAAPAASAPPSLRQRVLDHVRALQATQHQQDRPRTGQEAGHQAGQEPHARRAPGHLQRFIRTILGQPVDGTENEGEEGATPALFHPTGDSELDRVLLDLLLDPTFAVYGAPGAAEPGAFARLITASDTHHAALLASGLPAPAHGHAYQIWLLRDGHPVPNALFTTDAHGRGASLVRAAGPVTAYDTVAVTLEPAGGSPGPTGPVLLAGSLRAS